MRFIDVINITVISGNGGCGCISFQKNKGDNFWRKKPNGSDGGDGGNVWLLADANINTLNYFHFNRIFKAGNGQSGYGRGCTGRKGKDIVIKVPWGTRVSNQKTNTVLGEMGSKKKWLMVAKGGLHGLGNRHFKFFTCRRGSSKIHYDVVHGKSGESHNLLLELLLIADVGIFGLPNSGKSSFVRAISQAKPKVADYPFTTLIPCLGVVNINSYDRFVVADIPGIITGASSGSGLGLRFLKHLEHCRVLLHFIDIAPLDNSDPLENIIAITRELGNYSKELIAKPCWLVFNKIDLLEKYVMKKKIANIIDSLKWKGQYYFISSMYNTNISLLCDSIMQFIAHRN